MHWPIAVAALLLLATTARADMGAPWPIARHVPVRITITADTPPPGVELLLVPRESSGQRTWAPQRLAAGTPVVLESDARRFYFDVYSVPAESLARFIDPRPGPDGLVPNTPERRHVGGGRFDWSLAPFDGRAVIEEVYHVERQGESVHLRKVSDNEPSWWQSGSCCLCVLAVPIGLIWLGVRLARRRSA